MSRHWETSHIDKQKCTNSIQNHLCSQECVIVCPVEAIEIVNDVAIVNDKCIGCGACMNICPIPNCIEIKLPNE